MRKFSCTLAATSKAVNQLRNAHHDGNKVAQYQRFLSAGRCTIPMLAPTMNRKLFRTFKLAWNKIIFSLKDPVPARCFLNHNISSSTSFKDNSLPTDSWKLSLQEFLGNRDVHLFFHCTFLGCLWDWIFQIAGLSRPATFTISIWSDVKAAKGIGSWFGASSHSICKTRSD